MKSKYYLGCNLGKPKVIFRSTVEPTEKTTKSRYSYVIGPFDTMAGAKHVRDARCCDTVEAAERHVTRQKEVEETNKLWATVKHMYRYYQIETNPVKYAAACEKLGFTVQGMNQHLWRYFKDRREADEKARARA